MAQRTDVFDIGRLALRSGEGRRLDLRVALGDLMLGGQRYAAPPEGVEVRLDVSRTTAGYALRLRFEAALEGPCMRCLEDAGRAVEVDAREIDQAGGGPDLTSPYLDEAELDLASWARDALALALPAQIVCREECRGLCAICGANLNEAGEDHDHPRPVDPRWAKLGEIRFD